jgi:mono/diheme cytochrome c family protein
LNKEQGTGHSRCRTSARMLVQRMVQVDIVRLSASAMLLLAMVGSASSARAADTPETLFNTNCANCHGVDGHPTPTGKALKAAELSSNAVQKMTTAQFTAQIANGKGLMPPFKTLLTAEQIKVLSKYLRTFAKAK